MIQTIKRVAIAEFILRNAGGAERRVMPGEEVELTPGQVEKFDRKGCVHADDGLNAEATDAAQTTGIFVAVAGSPGAAVDLAVVARDQLNNDKLFEQTVGKLREIAKTEKIDLGEARRKDEIIAAIRKHRAGTPGVTTGEGAVADQGQRTDEGEAARRAEDAAAREQAGQ